MKSKIQNPKSKTPDAAPRGLTPADGAAIRAANAAGNTRQPGAVHAAFPPPSGRMGDFRLLVMCAVHVLALEKIKSPFLEADAEAKATTEDVAGALWALTLEGEPLWDMMQAAQTNGPEEINASIKQIVCSMPGSRAWIAEARRKIAAHVNGSFVTVIARSAPEKPEVGRDSVEPSPGDEKSFFPGSQPGGPAAAGS